MYSLLLVDDEVATIEGLSVNPWETLRINQLYKAYSAEEAFEIIETNQIDLVITDIRMPGKSGIDLIKDIYSYDSTIKCILLSGYAEFEYAKQALQFGAFDYLLKPVSDQEVLTIIAKAIDEIEREKKDQKIYQEAVETIEEKKDLLSGELFKELLQGRSISHTQLMDRLRMLQLSITLNDSFYLIMIRCQNGFLDYEMSSESIVEYAITNMANEIFSELFHLYSCRDEYGTIVLIMHERKTAESFHQHQEWKVGAKAQVELMAKHLQAEVKKYLKGNISLLLSNWGVFPDELSEVYQLCLPALIDTVNEETDQFVLLSEDISTPSQIDFLYEPPMLIHILETNNWILMESKINQVFDELIVRQLNAKEYKMEVFFVISNTFSYFVNKNSSHFFSSINQHFKKMIDIIQFGSLEQFREITLIILMKMKENLELEEKSEGSTVIQHVQKFVHEKLEEGSSVSLQEAADHVYLHPAYLSKIYKHKTGEGFSEFIHRTKMEKAAYLLANSNEKVHRIAFSLGYNEASYFIKVFKKHFSKTPNEYRNRTLID